MIKKINAKLRNNRGITLLAVLMVMTILLTMIGAGLMFSGINAKISSNYQLGIKAFYTADAGINVALGQLAENTSTATAALSGSLGNGLGFRSGHRTDTVAQPMLYIGTVDQPGYKLNRGSGYNSSGYTHQQYQLNMTGTYTTTGGTEVAGREVEVQAVYGPVQR